MSVNGTVTTLRAGGYEATVASVGASLLALTHEGRDLVVPRGADQPARAYEGVTLAPWPNRVVDARYAVRGTELHLPSNESSTGAALHGHVSEEDWAATDLAADSAGWTLAPAATEGYPFEIAYRVDYSLNQDLGLRVAITATNRGEGPAPVGLSTHPYLTCAGRPVDEYTLTVPAAAYLVVDDRLSPTELRVVSGDVDFTEPARVGERQVDSAYTELPSGEWSVEVRHPQVGGVRVTSDARWVQVYSGDEIGRVGLAVEPMTCEPDAFNRDPEGVLLGPGESRALRLTVSAI